MLTTAYVDRARERYASAYLAVYRSLGTSWLDDDEARRILTERGQEVREAVRLFNCFSVGLWAGRATADRLTREALLHRPADDDGRLSAQPTRLLAGSRRSLPVFGLPASVSVAASPDVALAPPALPRER